MDQLVSSAITSDTKGVVWLTDGPLRATHIGFEQINYLFDGLLTDAIKEEKNQNMVMTTNFGNSMFLFQVDVSSVDINEVALNVKPFIGDEQRVVIMASKSHEQEAQSLFKKINSENSQLLIL